MKSTKVISSDLQIPGFPEVVHLKQYDANTRYITIPITDGGSSFTLPDNPVFMIGARLPDGSKVLYDKIINASAPIGVLVSVDPVKWTAKGITGATFTKTSSGWSKDGSDINLDDFGVSITKGTPTTGANIVVSSENAVNVLSSGIEIGLAPSLSMIAGNGLIELYIGTNDELISSYCAELQIHEAAADPYSAFTSQSVCTIIAQIQAFVNAELTAHPEWTTTVQDGSIGREKLTPDVVKELDNKANNDGSYDDMTVGNAKQLVSSVGIEGQTPYNFRTSGGSTEIGDREELNAVVGGTVAWNQLLKEMNSTNYVATAAGTTASISDGVATVTAGSQYNGIICASANRPSIPTGHKVLGMTMVKLTTAIANAIVMNTQNSGNVVAEATTDWQRLANIWNWDSTKIAAMRVVDFRSTGFDAFQVKNCMFIDLTLLLGSTIANYIYALEQSNAGSGVAYFRKLFPKSYYAYNSGELLSVRTNLHRMVGFNQWDEEWERGGLPNGVPDSTVNKIRSKNYCRCVENTVYYGRIGGTYSLTAWFYDANNNVIGSASASNRTFTTPNSACYFKLAFESGYGTSYNDDVCINLSWDGERDGEYEPYQEWNYPLDSSLTLRGILELDANNNLYADGDTYAPDGTVTRRYGIVDLGTLTWAKPTATDYMNFSSNGIKTVVKVPPSAAEGYKGIICSLYSSVPASALTDKYIYITNVGQIRVKDTGNASLTETQFRTLMSGVYLVYELATPTTESSDKYTQTQIVDDFGTEEFVDAAVEANERDVAVPVGNKTVYKPNLRAKLEMMPDSPDGAGDYIMRSDGSKQTWVPLTEVKELPDVTTTDGTYVLKCTVSDGTATLTWVSE